MIHSIYTSVSNADIVPCGKKGHPIKSEPIPLLRDKYLGEYRTELERAKVRKNLGIADELSLLWGNIDGHVEDQKDLIVYVELKWLYQNDLVKDITTVKEALDYSIKFISQYEANTEAVEALNKKVDLLNLTLENYKLEVSKDFEQVEHSFENVLKAFEEVNKLIEEVNKAIENIDVNKNILAWVLKQLADSKTIELTDSGLEVILSTEENNAVKLIKTTVGLEGEDPIELTTPGIYVKDLSPEVSKTSEYLQTLTDSHNTLSIEVLKNSEAITSINTELDVVGIYNTTLPEDTSSSVLIGTTVSQLKGKSYNEILDNILFPTTVRDLIYPSAYYTISSQLVRVGLNNLNPELIFSKGDAGEEIDRTESITFNGESIDSISTYDKLGTYQYFGEIQYGDGDYLEDNKGEITDLYIPAGSVSASIEITTTYPWYTGIVGSTSEEATLVRFGSPSGLLDITLSGRAVIELPGNNSKLNEFTVDGGFGGYIPVDLTGWVPSKTTKGGVPYSVWTKTDSYSALLKHRINFTLAL